MISNAQIKVRVAARALARAGLVHAYGHCSLRLDADSFLVCAAKPMSLIGPQDEGVVVPVHGELPDGVLGEVRIHQHIYRSQPDAGAVIRSMPPTLMSLSAARCTPRRLHGMGSYFADPVPLWDDPQLIRSEQQAGALASTMHGGNAIVMRGNGVVIAAPSLEQAVVLTWYLEDAARTDWQLRAAGLNDQAAPLSADEAEARAVGTGRIFERMWDYLTAGDPELHHLTLQEQQ
ncbi:class II aldolase/adducin family protein [Janthinobacterium agaricidamnosum]|uniref:Class II Aldolase and Adducin N-terminal domain protein n=1 Tax=Janthinobacterium agaricidamnosum NBRC 102515 = DSM 9628 TaxID=1349767 RepID=W0UZ38_9BURK|nr:class II aldolase/adducin family protein [Janthinobacterium agaricidamnosum]CDG80901.1 class II Aldolase and Adducin N-terminal domain protein [Janthinobacterium agaricidamnosum NBRC 102515 = DSM 9628]